MAPLLRIWSAAAAALILTLALCPSASSATIPTRSSSSNVLSFDAHAACETADIHTYTAEWFARQQLRHDLWPTREITNALFYTRSMTACARKLAEGPPRRYTTIWDIWPAAFYNEDTTTGKLSCIMADEQLKRAYFGEMSRAFARMVRGTATVMHLSEHFDDPPVDGIWGKIELEEIKKALQSGHVSEIFKMDERGNGKVSMLDGLKRIVQTGPGRFSSHISLRRRWSLWMSATRSERQQKSSSNLDDFW